MKRMQEKLIEKIEEAERKDSLLMKKASVNSGNPAITDLLSKKFFLEVKKNMAGKLVSIVE